MAYCPATVNTSSVIGIDVLYQQQITTNVTAGSALNQWIVWPKKEQLAFKRAEEMLFVLLSDEQRKQYETAGYFEAQVDDRVYRIKKGRSGNVELIEKGVAKYQYCAHPSAWMPAPDVMAAQLLMLQTDEKKFLAVANRTVLHHQ